MACYDDFAWFYNRYWSEEFHSAAFPILARIWLDRLPPGAHILDVCCGTGYLAALVAARGFRVTGLDVSREMLVYARANAPAAEFILADAASFRLPRVCDAAVSTFDSLNHLLEPAALEAAFRNIAGSLAPGGCACVVVGNRTVKGVRLETDMILSELFENECGLVHEETIVRGIPNKLMPLRNSPSNVPGALGDTMANEYILVLRRPSA